MGFLSHVIGLADFSLGKRLGDYNLDREKSRNAYG
jgi:hypothetical protein